MDARFRLVSGGLALALILLHSATIFAEDGKPGSKEAVFDLQEQSALVSRQALGGHMLTRGQYAECGPTAFKEVKAYPKLNSKRPIYGKVKFDPTPANRDGIVYYFVIDESGEVPAKEKPKDVGKKAEEKKPAASLLKTLVATLSGEATDGTSSPLPGAKTRKLSRYDRLYFDTNRDLDLTNDPVLKPMEEPPWDALPPYAEGEKQVFEYLGVKFDYGPEIGTKPFQLLPWFMASDDGKYSTMYFASTVARAGTIRIGKREYTALLAQPYLISGRFDRPYTSLYLTPLDKNEQPSYGGFDEDSLSMFRRVDGELYTISVTPLGDKLKVAPYRGDLGRFQVGPGGRDAKHLSFSGSLRSETRAVAIGMEPTPKGEVKKVTECDVPVGDYLPSYVSVQLGELSISVSDNYHSDGKPRDMERRRAYNIHIRKDNPFILDFSNKPEILFASPAKDQTFKLGDEILVAAVLVDPGLDMMIRGLSDSRRTQKEKIQSGEGESTYERPLSLDPLVTITDSSGKTVAEGKLPFG